MYSDTWGRGVNLERCGRSGFDERGDGGEEEVDWVVCVDLLIGFEKMKQGQKVFATPHLWISRMK